MTSSPPDDIRAYAEVFPEGYFVALMLDGVPVGQGAGIYLDFDFDNPQHTIAGITGDHQCGNHDPDGAWYYGTDITVHPDHRGHGIGARLYDARKGLVVAAGKRGIIAGGSLPGFYQHKHAMTAAEYVDRVVAGDLTRPDPQLSTGPGLRGAGDARGLPRGRGRRWLGRPDRLGEPTMIETIGILSGSGWAAGINLYLVTLMLGVAGRAGWADIPDVLTRVDVMIVAGVLFVVEFFADKVPYSRQLLGQHPHLHQAYWERRRSVR